MNRPDGHAELVEAEAELGQTVPRGAETGQQVPAEADEFLPLVQQVVGLWFQMQERLQAHFAAMAAQHSLSAVQAKVMLQLDPATPITMSALATRLQYDPSNLTGVIDRLEALGAVRRQPDPRDRRVRGIVLTPTGVAMREPFWQQLINDVGPLGRLSVGELQQLRSILQSAVAKPHPDR